MTSGRVSIREVIAAGGVILGLVIVGYELRQANAMARIEATIASGQRWVDWNLGVATDAELSALFARVLSDDLGRKDLTAGEAMQVTLLYQSAVHGWETGYLNSLENSRLTVALPESRFFSGRFSRETWPPLRSEFHPGFAEVFETRYGLTPGTED